MKWLCIPGWATPPAIFNDLIPNKHQFHTLDLNFFNKDPFPEISLEGYEGLICYSLGSLLTLNSLEKSSLKKIVFIGGFTHFPGKDPKGSKLRKMKINLMLRGLKRDPAKVIGDFYTEAGLKQSIEKTLNVNNLIHGLELLRDCDMSHALCNTEAEIITIHGKDDVIVPEELNRMQFTNTEKERYTLDGNHGIIQSKSPEIKKILSEIV